MEKDTGNIKMVEQDMIRLAGGCILSIAVCSVVLMVPLLPCSDFGKSKESEGASLSSLLCLRLVLFLHGENATGLI
jgi:hypothetical protein